MAAGRHLAFDPTGNGAVRSAVPENPGQRCNQIQHTQLTDRRYQLTTTVDRTSLADVVHRSGETVHLELLQHYHSTEKHESIPSIQLKKVHTAYLNTGNGSAICLDRQPHQTR